MRCTDRSFVITRIQSFGQCAIRVDAPLSQIHGFHQPVTIHATVCCAALPYAVHDHERCRRYSGFLLETVESFTVGHTPMSGPSTSASSAVLFLAGSHATPLLPVPEACGSVHRPRAGGITLCPPSVLLLLSWSGGSPLLPPLATVAISFILSATSTSTLAVSPARVPLDR